MLYIHVYIYVYTHTYVHTHFQSRNPKILCCTAFFFACGIPKKNSPGLCHNLKLQRFTSSVVALRVVWEVRVISFSKIIIEFLVRWFENHYGFETLWWNHCGFQKNHSGFEKHHGFKNDKSFYCTVIAYSFGILFESIFLPVHYTLFTLWLEDSHHPSSLIPHITTS